MNILAVGAHPDDIEILCAGTLARYAQQGHAIFLASFTCGDMGDLEIAPSELGKIRKTEAEASAAILGAHLLWPAVTDELVFPNEEHRHLMAAFRGLAAGCQYAEGFRQLKAFQRGLTRRILP
jgi:LmbE family N-acetylglucosaminyl deacetylase